MAPREEPDDVRLAGAAEQITHNVDPPARRWWRRLLWGS
jgi:hypothetical protein